MAGTDRDINLVIRAKNDATKAIDSVSEALRTLAGIQDGVGQSAGKADGLLGELAQTLSALDSQAKSLNALGTVAGQIDRASAAVERLENTAKASNEAAAPLVEKYAAAAAATAALTQQATQSKIALDAQTAAALEAKAANAALAEQIAQAKTAYSLSYEQVTKNKGASDAMKQSLRDQGSALQVLITQQDQGKASYAAQRPALDAARTEYAQLDKTLQIATASQSRLQLESTKATDALGRAETNLAKARTELGQISEMGDRASAALGGVALTQEAISKASLDAAANLDLVKAAADRQNSTSSAGAGPIGGAAAATAAYRAQIAALRDAEAAMNTARSAASALGAAVATADGPTQQLTTDFLLAREAAATAEAEYQRQAATVNTLKGATQGFNTYLEREAAVLAQVSTAQQSTMGSGLQLARSLNGVEEAAQKTGNALKAPKSDGTVLFGLRPYELQNLSYQVNDIISGFASGQHATQILAQQGGQVFQLFQKQILSARGVIISLAPEIAVGIALGTTLIEVLKAAGDRADSVRQFGGVLAGSSDGALYDPTRLAITTRAITEMSTSLKDARLEVKTFVSQGVDDSFLLRFAKTAKDVSDVTGQKIPEAAKAMATAFTGGYDAIKRLDDASNFLSATEREHIKTLFDEGHAAEARTAAYDAFEKKQDAAATAARGPWSEAVRNLGSAWKGFIDYLGNTPLILGAAHALDILAEAARHLSEGLPGGTGAPGSSSALAAQIKEMKVQRDALAGMLADGAPNLARAKQLSPNRAVEFQRRYDHETDKLAALDKQIADAEASLVATKKKEGDTASPESEAAKKARQEVLDGLAQQRKALGDISDAQRILLVGENAYKTAIRETGDVKTAEAQRDLAVAKEVDRQRQAVNYGRLSTKIVGIESSGNASATNPESSATGGGQFVEKTWLDLFHKYYPEQAATLGKAAILDLRNDQQVTKQLVELYARQNAEVLTKAGVAVNEAALYLSHFLGASGAKKVLQASSDTSISSLLSPEAIAANPTILRGKTAGQVVGFAQGKVGTTDNSRATIDAQGALGADIAKRQEDLRKTIDDLLAGLKADAAAISISKEDKFVAERVGVAQKAAADKNLPLAPADRQAVEDGARANFEATQNAATGIKNAELETQINAKLKGDKTELTQQEFILNEAKKDGVNLTSAQGQEYAKLQGRIYDLTEGQKAFNNVIGLGGQVASLQSQLKEAFKEGDEDGVKKLQAQLVAILKTLREELPAARAFAAALGDQTKVAQLDKVDAALKNLKTGFTDAKEINAQLATGLTGAFGKVGSAIAGVNGHIGTMSQVLGAARDAFLNFAGDFLKSIAEMIIKQQLLILLQNSPIGNLISTVANKGAKVAEATAAIGVSAAEAGANAAAATAAIPGVGPEMAIPAGVAMQTLVATTFLPEIAIGMAHAGAIIGQVGGMNRSVSPNLFDNARRMHTGGIVGLAADEFPTILQKNEEVLTAADPRHAFNQGKSGGSATAPSHSPVKIVNAFAPEDVLAAAIKTEVGQKVILNHVRQNSAAWNSALGGGGRGNTR